MGARLTRTPHLVSLAYPWHQSRHGATVGSSGAHSYVMPSYANCFTCSMVINQCVTLSKYVIPRPTHGPMGGQAHSLQDVFATEGSFHEEAR